jgi:hypothetical protein
VNGRAEIGLVRFAAATAVGLWATPPAAAATADAAATNAAATVVVVVGAAGEEGYADEFTAQARLWEKASQQTGARHITVGLTREPTPNDRDRLREVVATEPKDGGDEFWLVLIGHGTFDNEEAKFNLRGPDLSATELALWLQPFRRPLVVINTASASAPFLAKLSAPGRVVLTATRSGYEQNATRFGRFLAAAVVDPQGDLDQDGQTSLLEAFLRASHQVAEFYKTEGRLATEHALIDDNGDGLGTPAEWFRGVRAIKKPQEGKSLDGVRAQQLCLVRSDAERQWPAEVRARRDELELRLMALREEKDRLPEEEYYRRLEAVLLEIARLFEPPET